MGRGCFVRSGGEGKEGGGGGGGNRGVVLRLDLYKLDYL